MRRGPVNFDRAVDYYDDTRSLAPETMRAMSGLLVRELSGRGRVLEIGAGTGRISLPLNEAGIDLTGVDVSTAMLARLVAKAGGAAPFPLVLGDALRLPFGRGLFDAAVGAHVLHLVDEPAAALDEIVRVVRGGGVFLSDVGHWETSVWGEIQKMFAARAGLDALDRIAATAARVDEAMAARGATRRDLAVLVEERTATYAEMIGRLESGMYSFTWDADQATRTRVATELRSWIEASWGALSTEATYEIQSRWVAYDLPRRPAALTA